MKNTTSNPISRRGFLGSSIALAGAAGTGVLTPRAIAAAKPVAGRKVVATDAQPIVETKYGKVRGSIRGGIYSFKGIPYGADTSGANRFQVAKPPTPWAGVKSTTCYTHTCPTGFRAGWNHDEERFIYDWSDGIPGEDVLNLSVWTPGINDNKKRAVLVWMHGGGYASGSNEELKSYDGERLAKRGDIVIVGVNHRLNILGFLNLEKFGDQYKNSQNISQLDLVASLQWIHDNIASFGGDPGAVTIFGQSGGGGKVTYLMGMPSAAGLFHRCISESPTAPRPYSQEQSAAYSDRVLAELGVTSAADLGKLQSMTYAQLQAGTQGLQRRAAAANPAPPAAVPGLGRSIRRAAPTGTPGGFAPSTGEAIPELPFYPNSLAISSKVPVISGNVLNEFFQSLDSPKLEDMTRDEVIAQINRDIPGNKGEAIYAATEKLKAPGRGVPFDILSQLGGIQSFRRASLEICNSRAAASTHAPAYNYQFRWQSPTFDGRPRAFHCAGLQFAFDNVDRCANATGAGPDAQAMADVMSETWIAFIKTGNPNHKGLPKWDPVTPGKANTMLFDNKTEQATNHDAEIITLLG
jgi:para-nitrobenzyl esterase